MTPPLHTLLESQVMTSLARLERVALLGWVSLTQLLETLPDGPTSHDLDVTMRRLIRRGSLELLLTERPPCSQNQCFRRREIA